MIRQAPYNPATLRRIRSGATAADLGWNEDRYRRICRNHGITSTEVVACSTPRTTPFDDLKFDDMAGEIIHAGAKVMLRAPIEVAIFGALLSEARKGKGEYLASTVFRSYNGRKWSRALVNRAVHSINNLVAVLELTVEALPSDGYRLRKATAAPKSNEART